MPELDDIDLLDPDTQENWFPTYDLLLREAPVFHWKELDIYVLTRHEDIAHVVRRPDLFPAPADKEGAHPLYKYPAAQNYFEANGFQKKTFLSVDPPEHRKYRDLVDPTFSAQGAKRMEPTIRRIVNELIDSWVGDGECEFVQQFALPLPVMIITLMLGFDLEDIPQLKTWSEAWVLPFAEGLSEADELYSAEKIVEFQHYIKAKIDDRRQAPRDDLLSHLLTTRFDGARPLSDTEIINILDHLYIGGNETTTFALTSGMWLLGRNPDVYTALQADRSLIRTFVEEVLRIESPTQGLNRYVAEDVEISGVMIPAGSTLHLRYAAANRDPRKFPDPERLDLRRKNASAHLAFSKSEHHCPGAGLSRIEQNIAWEIILDRLAEIRFTPGRNDFTHLPGLVLRGLKKLHISFSTGDSNLGT